MRLHRWPSMAKHDAVQRTWNVDRATAERLNVLSAEMQCFPSDLVNLLLQRGLAAIESGEWPLQRVPVKFRIDWAG